MRTRNNNGEGTCRYDETRKCYVFKKSFVNPISGEHERKAFYAKTQKDAKKKATAYLKELQAEAAKSQDTSLGDWLKQWLHDYIENTVKTKSYERYDLSINQYILPYEIAGVGLNSLTADMLQNHFKVLLKAGGKAGTGIAPRTVNAVRTLVRAALRKAFENGTMKIDVSGRRQTKAISVPRAEMHILTEEQSNVLIKVAKENNFVAWCIIVIALGTGMRIGEIFGLNWDSVNLDKKLLTVQRSVVSTNEGCLLQNTVKKTSSYRTIQLPQNVVDALKEYKAYRSDLGDDVVKGYLFKTVNDNFMDPANFSYRTYKRMLELAGIDKDVRFHDLRHTHATLLLAKGINIKVISERLGHANIRITLDTYSHVVPSLHDEAIKALDSIFDNKDA